MVVTSIIRNQAPKWLSANGENLTQTDGMQWVCISAKASSMLKIVKWLYAEEIDFFTPISLKEKGDYNHEKINVDFLWFNYISCKVDSKKLSKLRNQKNIDRILTAVDHDALFEEIRFARFDLDEEQKLNEKSANKVRIGQKIKLDTGPFSGLEAQVSKIARNGEITFHVKGGKNTISVKVSPTTRKFSSEYPIIKEKISVDDLVFADDRSREYQKLIDKAKEPVNELFKEEIISAINLEEINSALVEYFRKKPEHMHEISPRKYEELIAHIIEDMGAKVELTGQTRDGGRDILAVFKSPVADILTIVECKKYSPDNPVDIGIVRQFLSVLEFDDKANLGLIVTTSRFTQDAIEKSKEFNWRLGLRDFQNICNWIANYGNWNLKSEYGLWLPHRSGQR